ncbi:MAG TPA: YcgL domain-containing protein [Candidatus Competibacter sp.]|nr:YcgL domain-containing protein [Candidatus Competibacter sp.]
MLCAIYKSRKKQDTYLYMAAKDDFSKVPDNLLELLGEPIYIMDLELSPQRKLAQEDAADVLRNLQERGWHLQMPRQEEWPSFKPQPKH